jgi:hypothetical protein
MTSTLAAVLAHPQREQLGPKRAGILLREVQAKAVTALSEQMRFNGGFRGAGCGNPG